MMMYGGKKSTAERIMYEAMGTMEDRAKQDALKLFKSAVDNCKPAVEVKSRRGGGSPDQGPRERGPHPRPPPSLPGLLRASPPPAGESMAGRPAGRAPAAPPQHPPGG